MAGFPFGTLICALEWTTLMATHAQFGGAWKTDLASSAPNKDFSNGILKNDDVNGSPNHQSLNGGWAEGRAKVERRNEIKERDWNKPHEDIYKCSSNPGWVSACFQNEFRNVFGVFAILGTCSLISQT